MPRNASTGAYTAPTSSVNPAVGGTAISSTDFNALRDDIATALSTADATTRALWARAGQVQDGAFLWGGTAGGTADARTIALTPAITAYAAGQRFVFRNGAAANATTTPTLAVNGLAATTITRSDGTPLLVNDMAASGVIDVVYDGTNFRLAGLSASQAVGNDTATVTTTAAGFALTSSSARVQAVTFTADAQSVTLPDATTLTTGGPRYLISNDGTRPFGVRANGGALLAVVGPGGVAECYLSANGTAAGAWEINGRELLPALTICDATLSSVYTQTVEVAVRLTDTLSLHFTRNASGHPFVFAVDHSTFPATVGTPVLINAASQTVEFGWRISNNKATVVTNFSNWSNITVSGVTCTVNRLNGSGVDNLMTFTNQPFVAQTGANNDQFVFVQNSGGALSARVTDASGTTPVQGSSVNIISSGYQTFIGIYRVSDTTALALYGDDSGTPGSPFSIRGVVLSLSGTTITVNTSAGINDVVTNFSDALPSCQLSSTSYVVAYYQASGTLWRAAAITVSGTTVTFGTPLTVETLSNTGSDYDATRFNANRFQPNLFALSGTTALLTYGITTGSVPSRHVVLTNSGGTLTAGTILYGLWADQNGGNFPQETTGFMALSTASAEQSITSATVNGTGLNISGTTAAAGAVSLIAANTMRFGLSGGVRGVGVATLLGGRILLYRFRAASPPQFLGAVTLPNSDWGTTTNVPVEVSPSRVAVTSTSLAQNGGTAALIKLAILEFPNA